MDQTKRADAKPNGAKSINWLFWITAFIVLFLFSSAFILSYDALLNLAIDNGINAKLAFLWPLGLDAFMAASSLAVIWASTNQTRVIWFRALVGGAVLASIVGNIVHADGAIVAQAIAALPPIVAFLSFEVLMAMVRHETERAGLRSTLDELRANIDQARAEHDQAVTEWESTKEKARAARGRLRSLDEQLADQRRLVKELEEAGGDPIVARRRHLAALLQSTNGDRPTYDELLSSLAQAGYEIGLTTLKRDLKELDQ